jgi:hypothetical protein
MEDEKAKGDGLLGVKWIYIILGQSLHFLLSALVGLSVFWLTATILSNIEGLRITNYYINLYSFLVSLPFASLAHVLEDYWWGKF